MKKDEVGLVEGMPDIFSMEQMTALEMMNKKVKQDVKDDIKADIRIFINAVQKLEKKFNEMKEAVKPMMVAMKSYDEKHTAHYRMAKSLIAYMRDVDTKIYAVRNVFQSKYMDDVNIEVDVEWDRLRGLREKTDQEPIAVGDIVWVDYEAIIVDGPMKDQKFEESNLPVRIGSKALAFEEMLEKRFVGTTFTEEKSFPKEEYKDWQYAGNRIKFQIVIRKVKTSVPKV